MTQAQCSACGLINDVRDPQATASALALGVSGDTLLASRAVNLWHLDTHRLSAAVAHFAPGVRVIDLDTGQVRDAVR